MHYIHISKDNTLTLLIVKSFKLPFKKWHMKKQRIIIFKQNQITSEAAIELPSASSPTSNCKEQWPLAVHCILH